MVGSCVMDLIVSTEVFPGSGETVLGKSFQTAPGGKGANQAMQTALLGCETSMVGRVGDDDFGRAIVASCQSAGIDTSGVAVDPKTSTAVGNILLELRDDGNRNRIIVVPGANMTIDPADIEKLRDTIGRCDMVMLQLEIAMDINEQVVRIAHEADVSVMLNSAPAAPLSDELLGRISYISPNEHEAKLLTGIDIQTPADAERACDALMAKGVKNVLVTLGRQGAVLKNKDGFWHSPCIDSIKALDPTAAGDSFVGAFCTAVCVGASIPDALEFANYTATITVSRMGAQPSLPTVREVFELMKQFDAACQNSPQLNSLLA